MKKVLVIGLNGQLGKCLFDKYNEYKIDQNENAQVDYSFIDIETIDITNKTSVNKICAEYSPDFIVNCAAFTNVPNAEKDEYAEMAFKVNKEGPEHLAKWCTLHNAKFIHISTDYVYGGVESLISETSKTNPLNMYGKSKLHGDLAVIEECKENSIILRTSWLYSPYGVNFMKTMLSLFNSEEKEIKVVCDQIGSPTSAVTLAEVIFNIILHSITTNTFNNGIYHCTDEGYVSWFDFAQEILITSNELCNRSSNKNPRIIPISTFDFNTDQHTKGKQIVHRPLISLLDKSKLKKTFNIELPYWRQSLYETLLKYFSKK